MSQSMVPPSLLNILDLFFEYYISELEGLGAYLYTICLVAKIFCNTKCLLGKSDFYDKRPSFLSEDFLYH